MKFIPINNNSEKNLTNIRLYSNNKLYNQSANPQKFPINSVDSITQNESNPYKQIIKNPINLNNTINTKPKTPIGNREYFDDSIKKVDDASNIVKEITCDHRGFFSNNASKSNLNQTSKTSFNKIDTFINKFLNK